MCPLANGCVASPVIVKNRKCFADLNVLVIFGVNLPQIPSTDFYKIWHEGGSLRFAPTGQILPFWLSKYGLTAQKIAKNGNFGYKFSPKGYINLSDLYNILPGEESRRTAPSCQISPL